MSNVVHLGSVAYIGEPVAEVVALLERLLAEAQRGEIRSFAYGYVDGGNMAIHGWQTGTTEAAYLVAAVARLQWAMLDSWDRAATDIVTKPA